MSYSSPMTDEQWDLIHTLDDVHEHVFFEFDRDDYQGPGTCGFANIRGIDGRGKLVRRLKSVAERGNQHVERVRDDRFQMHIGGLQLRLTPDQRSGGYRLSVTNIPEIMQGPEHQRIDVRKRLHQLVMERFQYNWYIPDAYVTSRMD